MMRMVLVCWGEHGRGTLEHFKVDRSDVDVLVGTLGKSFGLFGAFVAGSDALIEHLIQFARPYLFTTALPSSIAHAGLTSLRLIRDESWRRERLTELVSYFQTCALQAELPILVSDTPIQALLLGEPDAALRVSQALLAEGIWIHPIRPPTVPNGTSRLRITFCANHTKEHVERLVATLHRVVHSSL